MSGWSEATESGLAALIELAASKGHTEEWVWNQLEQQDACCGRESTGGIFILELKQEHIFAVVKNMGKPVTGAPVQSQHGDTTQKDQGDTTSASTALNGGSPTTEIPQSTPSQTSESVAVKRPACLGCYCKCCECRPCEYGVCYPDCPCTRKRESSNLNVEVGNGKRWNDLSTASQEAMKEHVYADRARLYKEYGDRIDEPTMIGLWGGTSWVSDGKVTWTRLDEFKRKLRDEAAIRENRKLAEQLGVTLPEVTGGWSRVDAETGEKEYIMPSQSATPEERKAAEDFIKQAWPDKAEEMIAEMGPLKAKEVHNDQAGETSTCDSAGNVPEDIQPTPQPEMAEPNPIDESSVDSRGEVQSKGDLDQENQAEEIDELAPKALTPEEEIKLEELKAEGVEIGISLKLLDIWWRNIRRARWNRLAQHDLSALRNKIYNFGAHQVQVQSTQNTETGEIDVPGLLRSFGWVKMPALTDPDCPNKDYACRNPEHLHHKINLIGGRIAERLHTAAEIRKNLEVLAKDEEAVAERYRIVFGHLLSGDGESRLKYTKSGKDPGKITGGKTVTYPNFQICFEKTGGKVFDKQKTGGSLAQIAEQIDNELRQIDIGDDEEPIEEGSVVDRLIKKRDAILSILDIKTSFTFKTAEVQKLIDSKIVDENDLDGVTDMPLNEVGDWKISVRKEKGT